MKKLLVNLGLSAISGLVFILLLEFVVFRFIYPASDIAAPAYIDEMVRYQPGQEGVLRVKNEIAAKFKINQNGWNSRYASYQQEKDPAKSRIALLGDSYIAAFQVDYDKSLAKKLESKFDNKAEVYRFGIDGAPMSHYLYMLRHEVLKFNPDTVVVNLVHNDFNESYAFASGVFKSSFLKYKIEKGQVSKEVPPMPYKPAWYTFIREKSAIWKFLSYRQQVRLGVLRDLILGNDDDVEYWANINVSKIDEDAKNNFLTVDYTLQQMKNLLDAKGIQMLVLMGSDDDAFYQTEGSDHDKAQSVLKLNKLAEQAASKHNIDYIDLHPVFEKDYQDNQKPFSFVYDGHWNDHAHELVAGVLYDHLKIK